MFRLTTVCSAIATVTMSWGLIPAALPQENLPLSPPAETLHQLTEAAESAPLLRGPLHEAFAEAPQAEPLPNPIVRREPPTPINELPPEFKPEGANVQWIPGYWAWDEERNDFIWISGIWRDLPPGQRWVPGFWDAADGGFRWVNGFWLTADQTALEYYPPPPASQEVGPSTAAPSPDHFYAPGHWFYQADQYVWQPGCWMPVRPDWVFVPPTYVWTPCGYVFRPGYWDRLFDCRGVVFAPVCYSAPLYANVNYMFTPSCVINTNLNLLPHLFVRRNCRSYYFGDWYDDRYWGNDFCAWAQLGQAPRFCGGYDPFYSYYNRAGIQFNQVNLMFWVRSQNDGCRQQRHLRPPQALVEGTAALPPQANFPPPGKQAVGLHPRPSVPLAESLEHRIRREQVANESRRPFEHLDESARRQLQREQQTAQRAEIETRRRAERDSQAARLANEQAERRAKAAEKIAANQQAAADRAAALQTEREQRAAERLSKNRPEPGIPAAPAASSTSQESPSRLAQADAIRAADRAAHRQKLTDEAQARELEQAQRRAATQEKIAAAEQHHTAERESRRQAEQQQLQQRKAEVQQRQLELEQRRAADVASIQAATQQKSAERELRRQQEAAARTAQQQQQAERIAHERAAREAQNQQRQLQEQQRQAERTARQQEIQQRLQAEQQQRQIERQQRESERHAPHQEQSGKRGKG